jgi:hypothetical protein
MYGRDKILYRQTPRDPISAIATIGTALGGGMAAAGGAAAVLGAVGTIGTWVSVLGMATGNERLAKFGSVMGLVGSVGGWAVNAVSRAAAPTLANDLVNKSLDAATKNAAGAAAQGAGMLPTAASSASAAVQGVQAGAASGVETFALPGVQGATPTLAEAPVSATSQNATGLINSTQTEASKLLSNTSRPLDAVNPLDRMPIGGASAPSATVPAASGTSGFSLKGLTETLQPLSDFFDKNEKMFSAIGGIAKYMQPSDNMRVFETWQRNANDIPVYRSQFNPAPAR